MGLEIKMPVRKVRIHDLCAGVERDDRRRTKGVNSFHTAQTSRTRTVEISDLCVRAEVRALSWDSRGGDGVSRRSEI